VAKGFTQKYGVDFEEICTLIIRKETNRLMLSLESHKIWLVHHMDVKLSFLNFHLNDEVYVEKHNFFFLMKRRSGIQVEKGIIWVEIGPQSMVHKN